MLILIAACFFTSGISGLAYEILWLRELSRLFGAGPHAVSIVVAAFMGALGLGGWIGGRLSPRLARPIAALRTYGGLEIGIGIYALGFPGLLATARPIVAILYEKTYAAPFLYHTLLFLLVVLLLLPPVAGMGATLPVLTRYFLAGSSRFGARLGFLYGLNTLGAATGTLLSGLVLVPWLGLAGTLKVVVAANLLVGLLALYLAAREKGMAGGGNGGIGFTPRSRQALDNDRSSRPLLVPVVLLGAALSGYCAMAYQVIWTRLLGLMFGPTTYTFTLILAIFILAMALGAWASGRVADRFGDDAAWPFAFAQVLAAILAVLASQKIGTSQIILGKILLAFDGEFGPTLAAKGLLLAVSVGGPVFLLGTAFPFAARLLWRPTEPEATAVGGAYAASTAGGVIGAWSAGFLLLPILGKEASLSLLAGLQAIGALAFAIALRSNGGLSANSRKAWGALASLVIVTLAVASFLPRWDRAALARIAGYRPDPGLMTESWPGAFLESRAPKDPYDQSREVFHGDGIGGFTSVWRSEDALGVESFTLYNSGKADASSDLDRFTQVMLAHFPMALHPDPKRVMVLGLASGMTAGEALRYPIDSLDILEINEQVVEASRFFAPWNNRVLSQPRTRLILQDAKAHLLLTRRRYEVIISEPSNPWMAGLAELFTAEFYRSARDRLTEDGIMVQFIHSYQMDWPTFAMVGRTFAREFPVSMLVRTLPDERAAGEASDYLLVGFKSEAPLRFRSGAPRWSAPAQDPPLVHLEDSRLLYRLVVAENLPELFGEGPYHTDDRPHLEHAAPRLMQTFNSAPIEAALATGRRLTPQVSAVADSLRGDAEAQIAYARFALSVERPFPGMVDTAGLAPEQRGTLMTMAQEYCANRQVQDFRFLEGEYRSHCAAAQMAMLNRRLQNPSAGANATDAAAIRLAMGIVCRANGLPQRAMEFLDLAIREGGEGSPWALAARREKALIERALGGE